MAASQSVRQDWATSGALCRMCSDWPAQMLQHLQHHAAASMLGALQQDLQCQLGHSQHV